MIDTTTNQEEEVIDSDVDSDNEMVSATEDNDQEEVVLSELNQSIWSVVSFEKCLQSGLTYDEAVLKMEKSATEKKFGLCIVTDEVAQRI